jgi:hypothetical protein
MIGNDWPSISDETSEYQVAKIPGIGTLVQAIIRCTRLVQEGREDEARPTLERDRRMVERPDMFSSVGSSEQSQSAETARTDDTFSPGSFDMDEEVFDQLRGLPGILSEKVIQEHLRFLLNWCVQQPCAMPEEVDRYEYQVQTVPNTTYEEDDPTPAIDDRGFTPEVLSLVIIIDAKKGFRAAF